MRGPWAFEEGNGSFADEPEMLPCIGDANGVVLMQIYLDPYGPPMIEEKIAAMKAAVEAINREPASRAALKSAINHIEHMAQWITSKNAGYHFESLGEDMQAIRAAYEALGGNP